MRKSLVSVIVTTKNEAANIATCLKSVKGQSYQRIEVIVVDNASTDTTVSLAKKYTSKVYQKGPERSAQRNYGAEKARGVYLLFLDADMKLTRHVISECVAKIEEGGIGGVIIPEQSYGEGFWAACKALEKSFYLSVDWMEAARFYRKASFDSVRGFNLKMISGEDWDLSQRIRRKYSIVRARNCKVLHNEGKMTLLRTMRKKFYYAQKISQYQQKNRNSTEVSKQMSIVRRYGLFLSDHKKLFASPTIGIGMLIMKGCEFFAGGLGYILVVRK